MTAPNLATRPFLNTRPVWLVTLLAVVVGLGFAATDVRLYLRTNQSMAELLARRDRLETEHAAVKAEARANLEALAAVRWSSLEQRVGGVNRVLREHAFSWLEMLTDIGRVLPYAVRLVKIAPSVRDERVSLSLEAVARNREAMLDFIDNLISDPSFAQPLPKVEETPEESESGAYLFILTVEYRPGVSP